MIVFLNLHNANTTKQNHEIILVPNLSIARLPSLVGLVCHLERRIDRAVGNSRLGRGHLGSGGTTASEGESTVGQGLAPSLGVEVVVMQIVERNVVCNTTEDMQARTHPNQVMQHTREGSEAGSHRSLGPLAGLNVEKVEVVHRDLLLGDTAEDEEADSAGTILHGSAAGQPARCDALVGMVRRELGPLVGGGVVGPEIVEGLIAVADTTEDVHGVAHSGSAVALAREGTGGVGLGVGLQPHVLLGLVHPEITLDLLLRSHTTENNHGIRDIDRSVHPSVGRGAVAVVAALGGSRHHALPQLGVEVVLPEVDRGSRPLVGALAILDEIERFGVINVGDITSVGLLEVSAQVLDGLVVLSEELGVDNGRVHLARDGARVCGLWRVVHVIGRRVLSVDGAPCLAGKGDGGIDLEEGGEVRSGVGVGVRETDTIVNGVVRELNDRNSRLDRGVVIRHGFERGSKGNVGGTGVSRGKRGDVGALKLVPCRQTIIIDPQIVIQLVRVRRDTTIHIHLIPDHHGTVEPTTRRRDREVTEGFRVAELARTRGKTGRVNGHVGLLESFHGIWHFERRRSTHPGLGFSRSLNNFLHLRNKQW